MMEFVFLSILLFLVLVVASIPSLYFSKHLFRKNVYYASTSLLLSLGLIFHGIVHLLEGILYPGVIVSLFDALSSISIFGFAFMYWKLRRRKIEE